MTEMATAIDQPPTSIARLLSFLHRITRTLSMTAAFSFALLSYPSVLPWMVAFWLAWHTVLAIRHRPGFVPLIACLAVLVIKLVARTPAMLFFVAVVAVVAWMRWKLRGDDTALAKSWWKGSLVLWLAWGGMFWEYRSIEQCHSPHTLQMDRPVVCLGDSLTDGLLPDHGYPEQLKSLVRIPVINLGFSGIATSQGLNQMDRVLSHKPQVVVIELGGHDFLKGRSRSATKQNLVAMIEACHAEECDVILMEIPRGFIIDPFASLEREIAYEQDVQLVSDSWLRQIITMSPIAPPGMWMPDARLSDDGIHSNARGSMAIARDVRDALASMYGDEVLSPASP